MHRKARRTTAMRKGRTPHSGADCVGLFLLQFSSTIDKMASEEEEVNTSKKLINNSLNAVDEALEGFVAANPGLRFS